MRNLVYRVGAKTSLYHLLGGMPNSGALIAMLQHIATSIYSFFATLAPWKHPKRSILATAGSKMGARVISESELDSTLYHVWHIRSPMVPKRQP